MAQEGAHVRVVPLPEHLDTYDKKLLDYSLADKIRSLRALIHYNRKIWKVAEDCEVDGIWARGTRGVLQVGLSAWWSQTPLVWDIGVEHHPRGVVWMLHGLSLFLSDKVVTQGEEQPAIVCGHILSTICSSRFQAIHPGLAGTRITKLRKATLQANDGKKQLITVASIHPRKNQMMTLQAFARVCRDHPSAQLSLVGPVKNQEYFRTLRDFVQRNRLSDRVHFLGWRDDVPSLLAKSDALVLSSHREGVPHVVREAMFAEVPVIATAVGGVPEAVRDGETGFLVPPDGVDQLGECIDYLLSHPEEQEQMGKRGFQLAQQRFSREAWLSEYREVLSNLSRNGRR
ncbi:glycosyltransferase family 4 protein [Salinibacter ruber]|uniref:Glycosyltransferase involved in cell wall biosynthesis n=2 Tax=Salinibacter ruber TaxID=146919 RepID=A0A9X2U9P9_9BACT|nr:glycosyltransferase involved in cell wall biosynthesis [Salinibacter ruber]MCS3952403.1 glycosyltransferase involved in cell wall biosynthesis [Salinibacter ruber]MCS4118852.1 glycosyltransferase involved in cell wall biosynthesis [Salinibacter ruber]MCS4155168.1 glycosyltransferase involved in cell wall biosynthesis [Salinibacter ruber]MCS4171871.1 glycosyltransferase involved in cell wall biosynthesis [Salinibacter ruber]